MVITSPINNRPPDDQHGQRLTDGCQEGTDTENNHTCDEDAFLAHMNENGPIENPGRRMTARNRPAALTRVYRSAEINKRIMIFT